MQNPTRFIMDVCKKYARREDTATCEGSDSGKTSHSLKCAATAFGHTVLTLKWILQVNPAPASRHRMRVCYRGLARPVFADLYLLMRARQKQKLRMIGRLSRHLM